IRRHTRFSRDWSSDVCSYDLQGDLERDHDERMADGTQAPLGGRIDHDGGILHDGRGGLTRHHDHDSNRGWGRLLRRSGVRARQGEYGTECDPTEASHSITTRMNGTAETGAG